MLPVQQFTDYIKKNALFTEQDNILLAVSGGKDSVLMLQLFKLSNYKFSIAHCNFNLRADESQRDEAFVRLLAASLEVPLHVAHFDTKAYAAQHHISLQMAARELRYQWFEEISRETGHDYIAVAHHKNDAIETLLLNLTRGTGISGLHGILPKKEKVVRPLLFLSREDIDNLIAENSINFVEDSSNESSKYARNKIRLNVIPHLREINPSLEQTFDQNIQRFLETEEVLHQFVENLRQTIIRQDRSDFYLAIDKLRDLKPQKLLLFELLKPFHFTDHLVCEVLSSLHKQSGKSFYSKTHRATINRKEIIISPLTQTKVTLPFFIASGVEKITVGDHVIQLSYGKVEAFKPKQTKAVVDLEKLIFPLVVRFWQKGDRFIPFGMNHSKKLSDFFIDAKVPLPQKDKIPLVINGNGEIIWVAGLRQDNRYKVGATTKKVAIFEILNPHGQQE